MTQKYRKLFPWESGSDRNGQSKMRGSDAQFSYAGVRSAILAQVALGPLVKLWMAYRFDPRGVTYSSLCFWTRAAVPGIHLAASKPSIRVQIGQRGPILPWHHRKLGACSTHFTPRNFFHSGSISTVFFGNLLKKGVLRGFKHPNTPVAVDLTEL